MAATLHTLKEATRRVSVEFLWKYFNLAGEPAKSCLSPFREEHRPSFSVFIGQDGRSRFNDFASGEAGDAFDFFKLCTNLEGRAAIRAFEEISPSTPPLPLLGDAPLRSSVSEREVRPLTGEGQAFAFEAAARLKSDEILIARIAASRGWTPATIHRLASEQSLGWAGCLAYLYETGVKLRSDYNGQRRFYWKFGTGAALWRQARIQEASTVYVTEGESDAITLLDEELDCDATVAVVAIASATTFAKGTAGVLNGRDVVLCFDADDAGAKAEQRLLSMIAGTAKSVSRVDVGRLLQ